MGGNRYFFLVLVIMHEPTQNEEDGYSEQDDGEAQPSAS